jgi:capsular exopolysaccharide synthesis family protein
MAAGGAFLQNRPSNARERLAMLRAQQRLERPSGVQVEVERVRQQVQPAYAAQNSFIFTEAHARLATHLGFVAPQPNVVLVTSALPRDGKTTVSSNLALALVRAGHRVLLIDADLRGGSIARLLGIASKPGLADLLAGKAEPAQVVAVAREGQSGDLHVIPAGVRTHTPAELLGSPHARTLVTWAKATYDSVIIDTPPITSVADVAVLAPLVDGVILVARSGATAREALVFAMEQLRLVRAPLLGAVLNDVNLERDAAYDGAYEYYGRYATSEV